MTDMNEFNQNVIAEFREKAGALDGMFEGTPMLILHTSGAKSGLERLNPLTYQLVGESWAIFASKAGAPTHPDWYHNVVANPDVSIEVGTDTVPVRARVAEGAERDEIYTVQKTNLPDFANYEASAGDRVIPVVVLDRR